MVTGPHRAKQTTPHGSRRGLPYVFLVRVVCVTAGALTSSAPTPAASTGTIRTTWPNAGPLAPVVRPGQPYVTPGHDATVGPIGSNPSESHGVTLTILNGLVRGESIFNADSDAVPGQVLRMAVMFRRWGRWAGVSRKLLQYGAKLRGSPCVPLRPPNRLNRCNRQLLRVRGRAPLGL